MKLIIADINGNDPKIIMKIPPVMASPSPIRTPVNIRIPIRRNIEPNITEKINVAIPA